MNKRRPAANPRRYMKQKHDRNTAGKNLNHTPFSRSPNRTCHRVKPKKFVPFMICGKVFNPVLPQHLSKKDSPIVLTQATVHTEGVSNLNLFIDFSGFVTSTLREERFNNLVFQLVRSSHKHNTTEVLREWPFLREFVSDTEIKEPVVYDFCESIPVKGDPFTYTVKLIEVKLSEQSSYNITNKSMTAQVFQGPDGLL